MDTFLYKLLDFYRVWAQVAFINYLVACKKISVYKTVQSDPNLFLPYKTK